MTKKDALDWVPIVGMFTKVRVRAGSPSLRYYLLNGMYHGALAGGLLAVIFIL